MRERLLVALAALLVLAGASQDYNAFPPVYASNVYDSNVESGSLIGANTSTGQLIPITLGTNLSETSGTLNASGGSLVSVYNSSGTLLSSGPEKLVMGISGSCTSGSGTPSACTASVSWTSVGFTSSTSFSGWCDATSGSTVNGTNFIPDTTTTASVSGLINSGGAHTITFTCTALGY
jgi:hypothetical protein